MPRLAGHEHGTDNIRRITTAAAELGISYLTLWAFSTDNWRRPREEIDGIMRFWPKSSSVKPKSCIARAHSSGISVAWRDLTPTCRRPSWLPSSGLAHNDRLVLTLAFNYSGRQELLAAVKSLIASGVPADDVDEELLEAHLFTRDLPDPDLIIRTSGEHRISNFLFWQSAYSELFFTPTLWPDFGPDDLFEAVREYGRRERRFGGVPAHESAAPLVNR